MNLFFLYLMILLFPIATEFSFGLRIIDVVLVFLVLITAIKVSKINVSHIYFASFFIILLLSNSLASLMVRFQPSPEGLILLFKLLVNIFSFFIIKNIFNNLNDIELKKVFNLFLTIIILLNIWCFVSFAIDPLKRVGFPFSQSFSLDSHAFGSLLSLLTLFLFLNWKSKTWCEAVIMFCSIISTFLASLFTGSRSIAFLFIIFATLIVIRSIYKNKLGLLFVTVLIGILITPIVWLGFTDIDLDGVRSVQFSIQNASEAKRLDRLLSVFKELDSVYYAFGRGILTVNTYYFDGSLTFMLYNFGLLGATILIIALTYSSGLYILKGYSHYLFTSIALSALLVSEFFLIGRWYVPVIIAYMILYEYFKRSRLESETTWQQK